MHPGDTVILSVPENPRLHGQPAAIRELTDRGAHVTTTAAATGHFRALFAEMVEPEWPQTVETYQAATVRAQGYSGDICDLCGSVQVIRTGTCLTCTACGTTSGC